MGKASRETEVLRLMKQYVAELIGCLYSAIEVHLKREGRPVSDELLQLKRRLEEVKEVWVAGKRRRGEEEGEEERVKEEVEDVREFWEVVESANVPVDLVEVERKVEEMVCKLE